MKKVYMIGNTHFDPVWLWKWDEAMSSITATFRSALDRMKEYPDFKYSFATPPVFDWIKKTSPEMFEEIKERVKEGRWDLAEGWWVQPDCYTPSGESLVRQGLYGQRYLKENFGQYSEAVFNIDSFGHPPMLPQILLKSGIRYYVMCRPERRHIQLESPLFHWKSKDGSQVMVYRDDMPYKEDTGKAIDEMAQLPHDTMVVYGVTDHGGAPTIKSIGEIQERENAVFSTVKGFFENSTTDYTVEGEFVTGDFGVYVNHPEIKKMNRIAEYALLNAEKASVIAGNYDGRALENCWKDVLFNQFHDILGGACIKDAYFDANNVYGRAIATANEIMHFNLMRVTNKIYMPGKNPDNIWNIVVWNLNCDDFEGYVEAEVQWAHEFPWYDKGLALEDAEGNRYECQVIRALAVIPRFRSRFVFKAKVPSMGYKAFKLVQTNEELVQGTVENLRRVETQRYVFTLSENGCVDSIYDKKEQKDVVEKLLHPLCVIDDGDTWTFNVESYGEECEPFELQKLELIEKGALRTIIKATYSFRQSKLEMYYTLYENENYMDVKYRVNWNEKHLAFKLVTDVKEEVHTASVSYGAVERNGAKCDVPMGQWLTADNLIFVSDAVFAYDMYDKRLGLTVLRSAIYGDFRLGELDVDVDYDILSQGITEGNIRVCFGKENAPCCVAASFHNPPIVLCEANHEGVLGACQSYVKAEAESVEIVVVKKAEDGESIILRGVEYAGKAQSVIICAFDREYKFDVAPYEIFTLRIDRDKVKKVNMLEE